jgi:hypothetical protein
MQKFEIIEDKWRFDGKSEDNDNNCMYPTKIWELRLVLKMPEGLKLERILQSL